MYNLVKSPRRLAMEIKGKSRTDAENHLVRYGASVSGAAAAVGMCMGTQSKCVVGFIEDIAYCIETNC